MKVWDMCPNRLIAVDSYFHSVSQGHEQMTASVLPCVTTRHQRDVDGHVAVSLPTHGPNSDHCVMRAVHDAP